MARQHARYSPSKLGSKEKCPQFEYQQAEEGEQNEAAEEGELMHLAYETGVMTGLNDEQKAQVEKIIQYTETLTAGLKPEEFDVFSEIKLEIPDMTYGYADRVILIKDKNNPNKEDHGNYVEAHVIDAKFGRKGADAADSNVQVMCYAGALIFGYASIYKHVDHYQLNVPVVHGHIVSPRLDSITTVTYTMDDQPRILGRIEKILESAANPFSQPRPDPDLCTLCQWRASCPAVSQLAKRTTENMGLIPSILDPEQIAHASPEDKSKAYALAQILEAWSESAKKVITKAVLAGDDIPNYTKVKRAASAKVSNSAEAIAMLQNVVPEHVIHAGSSLSLAKLANAYSEDTGKTKGEAREFIEQVLAPVIEQGPDIVFLQRKRGVSEKDILSAVPQLDVGSGAPQPE